jgi:hypothetical protein
MTPINEPPVCQALLVCCRKPWVLSTRSFRQFVVPDICCCCLDGCGLLLLQVFLRVCAAGALPMAPRLACVCASWAAAVAETPELWRILDTQYLPAAGSAKSPAGKRKKGGAAQQRRHTADEGLASWLATGRLQQLQVSATFNFCLSTLLLMAKQLQLQQQ